MLCAQFPCWQFATFKGKSVLQTCINFLKEAKDIIGKACRQCLHLVIHWFVPVCNRIHNDSNLGSCPHQYVMISNQNFLFIKTNKRRRWHKIEFILSIGKLNISGESTLCFWIHNLCNTQMSSSMNITAR